MINKETAAAAGIANLIVNGITIEAPAPYITEQGVIMLPLKSISAALGYDVIGDETLGAINVGQAVSLTVGTDYYKAGQMPPIALGVAPAIVEQTAYVPVQFFQQILNCSVIISDGMIDIHILA